MLKNIVRAIVLLLCLFSGAIISGDSAASPSSDALPTASWVDVRSFKGDLAAAIKDSRGKKVLISSPTNTLLSTLVIPADVQIEVVKDGLISQGSHTLIINGRFSAGSYQTFGGSGSVRFGAGSVKEVYPQWWGAKGDGRTHYSANSAAFDAAMRSMPNGGIVSIPTGTYLLDTVLIYDNITWEGAGPTSYLKFMRPAENHFVDVRGRNVRIRNLAIDGNGIGRLSGGRNAITGSALSLNGNGFTTKDIIIEDCTFYANGFDTVGGWNVSQVIFSRNVVHSKVSAVSGSLSFVEGSHHITISENSFPYDGQLYSIALDNLDSAAYPNKVYAVIIRGNTIERGAGAVSGIDIQNARQVTVSENRITLSGGHGCGIRVYTTADAVEVTGNIIRFAKNAKNNIGIEINGQSAGTKQETVNVADNRMAPEEGAGGGGTGISAYYHSANISGNIITKLHVGIQIATGDHALAFELEKNTVQDCVINFNISGRGTHWSVVNLHGNQTSGGSSYNYIFDQDYIYQLSQNPMPGTNHIEAGATVIDDTYLARDNATVSTMGASETILGQVTLPPNFHKLAKGIRISAVGRKTGERGNKTLKLYIGSTAYTVQTPAGNANEWRLEAMIMFDPSGAQESVTWTASDGATLLRGDQTATENMTVASKAIGITGSTTDARDAIVRGTWLVEVL